jgi:hypothetical protein
VPYRATGKSWLMDVDDRPFPARDPMLAAFLEEVGEVGEQHLQSSRLALRLPPGELDEFREKLRALFTEYMTRPARPDAERWSLYFGMHPEA